jgi:hypothetical protein
MCSHAYRSCLFDALTVLKVDVCVLGFEMLESLMEMAIFGRNTQGCAMFQRLQIGYTGWKLGSDNMITF